MENTKMTRPWWMALALLAAIVFIAAAAVMLLSVRQATAPEAPVGDARISLQWQAQSEIEARFAARIAGDLDVLHERLLELAKVERAEDLPDPAAYGKTFEGHFLRTPRLVVDGRATEGWENVLRPLWEIVRGKTAVSLNYAWGTIEYVPYDKVLRPPAEEDVDFRVGIKVGFSASPGDNILEGDLLHRRICEIGT